ncbi:DUF4926 domain-containing protein [Glycomyces albidus]|jgi:hypothetical protein|uniref:DUF4926 domain-containing protein n=1 Tax=Glycomyces albidus TaxID=2656774 RepID=A0A6L5G4P7_9ACTN|nr:DUF4926 domain-containing protein [Glycomyces albidus]MQM24623.1 DUF4926 domain-containing protein [Glycomyces albidus]
MNLYDVVELAIDLPEKGLREGMIGTIVDVYDDPQAFEVEFDDEDGVEIALLALKPEQLRSKR